MIEAKNISVSFDDKPILQDISCSLSRGVTCILGQNGAGKSTLLQCLSGGIAVDEGVIEFEGQDLSQCNIRQLAQKRAVLGQSLNVGFPFRAMDIVMMGRAPFIVTNEKPYDVDVAHAALERLGAYELKDRIYSTLSGGEKQRVQLARVLSQLDFMSDDLSGKYLFLDEPTSALDVKHQRMVLGLIDELRSKGLSILAVMHDINVSCEIADHAVLLKGGRMLGAHRISEQALQESLLVEVYDAEPSNVLTAQSGRTYYHF
ncbi:MAG: ATP-binding cassette domain-containing protein [Alphaproteobacteria bacterium]|nr:ATP-binding cassette domain-containing protein [Alphaproteobacteria bacterium]